MNAMRPFIRLFCEAWPRFTGIISSPRFPGGGIFAGETWCCKWYIILALNEICGISRLGEGGSRAFDFVVFLSVIKISPIFRPSSLEIAVDPSVFYGLRKFNVGCTQEGCSLFTNVPMLAFPARWRCTMTSQNDFYSIFRFIADTMSILISWRRCR
jgi:hypothetical protein